MQYYLVRYNYYRPSIDFRFKRHIRVKSYISCTLFHMYVCLISISDGEQLNIQIPQDSATISTGLLQRFYRHRKVKILHCDTKASRSTWGQHSALCVHSAESRLCAEKCCIWLVPHHMSLKIVSWFSGFGNAEFSITFVLLIAWLSPSHLGSVYLVASDYMLCFPFTLIFPSRCVG